MIQYLLAGLAHTYSMIGNNLGLSTTMTTAVEVVVLRPSRYLSTLSEIFIK